MKTKVYTIRELEWTDVHGGSKAQTLGVTYYVASRIAWITFHIDGQGHGTNDNGNIKSIEDAKAYCRDHYRKMLEECLEVSK